MSIKKFRITINGEAHEVEVEELGTAAAVAAPAAAAPAAAPRKAAAKPAAAPAAGGNTITAPLQGTVSKIMVSAGQAVKKGDVLCIIEAMKMENEVMVDHDCTIAKVMVNPGDKVSSGDALIALS